MSTLVTQQVYGTRKKEAMEAVNRLLSTLDKKLSLFIVDSDIDRINQNAGIAPVEVESDTFALVAQAKKYSELSKGRFDLTIAPVTLLWGIDTDNARVPSKEEIEEALTRVDYRNVQLNTEKQTVFLQNKGMKIDLGGIAKGFMAGVIGDEYKKYDIQSALVSIGGNICIYGVKPDGSPYTLGIRDPESASGEGLCGRLKASDEVVATSGAYERYFEKNGKRYHHIFNPKTGYPVESDLLSVTVIAKDGGLADYLSTTLYAAGSEFISSYLNDGRFSVIVVDAQKKVHVSKALAGRFELTGSGYELAEDSYERTK